jgi:hypothetical protein
VGVGGEVQLGPLGTAATNRPVVPAAGDYDDGEIGGMIDRGNRSTRRKPTPVPLCPPPVGSQRLTAWATARPWGAQIQIALQKTEQVRNSKEKLKSIRLGNSVKVAQGLFTGGIFIVPFLARCWSNMHRTSWRTQGSHVCFSVGILRLLPFCSVPPDEGYNISLNATRPPPSSLSAL